MELLSAPDYDLLCRYWNEEPWGAYRDNLHAAIVAREVRRTAFKGKHRVSDFMLVDPAPRHKQAAKSWISLLKTIAVKKQLGVGNGPSNVGR